MVTHMTRLKTKTAVTFEMPSHLSAPLCPVPLLGHPCRNWLFKRKTCRHWFSSICKIGGFSGWLIGYIICRWWLWQRFDVVWNIKVSFSVLLNYLKLDSGNLHVKGSRGSGPEPFKRFFHHLIPMGNRGKVNVEKLNCPNNPLIAVAVACRVGAVQKWRIEIKFASLVCFHEKRLNALFVNIC